MSDSSDEATDESRKFFSIVSGSRKQSLLKTFQFIRENEEFENVRTVRDRENTLFCTRVSIDPEEGKGFWDFNQISDDLFIIATNFLYFRDHEETVPGEDLLEFHFKVSGELLMEVENESILSVRGPSLLIHYQPPAFKKKLWLKGGARESSVTLYCKPGLFTETLGMNPEELPPIVSSFVKGEKSSIKYELIPLNPALGFSITNLLRTKVIDKFHLVHTRVKTLDLLCDILRYLCSSNTDEDEGVPLSNYEKQMLQKARDILSTKFDPPPTIKGLAREIGINETKLKIAFKKLFGATIHEYSNYHRMQKAVELLQTTEMSMSDIARSVGYSYQTSFTSAVKHFFGVTPKQLRVQNYEGDE